jgi:PGF-pre-PGF domain-containing protein
MRPIKAILIIFAFAVFLCHSVYGAPEVRVSEGIVSGSEPFTNLSITLSEAPNGLSGYNITISLSNASIAEIISVDFPDWALLNKVSLLPAESAWIKAVDLQNSIIKGANNVILANVTFRGKSEGIARVLLTVRQIDDDDGYPLLETSTTPLPTHGGNGGSSGSSGGGDAASDEDFKNIEKQESRDVDIHSGQVVYKFTTQDIIREIGFDAKTSEGLITAKIEYLKGRPKKAAFDAPGSVFKYFNVVVGTSGYGSSSKLENAFIVFDVPDEWLRDNNLDSVKAMKFKDSSWIDLKTEKTSPGTYKASSPGFSGFAIVGTSAASMEKINPSSTTSVANTVSERENKFSINLFLLLLVVIVLIAVAFAYFKRKELSRKK